MALRTNLKWRFLSVCLIFLLCIPAGCGTDGADDREKPDRGSAKGTPVARIGENGAYIYDYEYRYIYSLNNGANCFPDQEAAVETEEAMLREAAVFKTKYLLAAAAGFVLSEEERTAVDDAAYRFAQMQLQTETASGAADEDGILQYLYGVSLTEYQHIMECETVIRKYLNHRYQNTEVNETECRQYYEANRGRFLTVHLRVVMYRLPLISGTENTDEAAAAQVMAHVQQAMTNVHSEEDMMALIARESEEDGVDDGGGLRIIFPETLSENDIFRPFVEKNDLTAGDTTVVRDQKWIYGIRCERILTYDSSDSVRQSVTEAYITEKTENDIRAHIMPYESIG